MTWNEYYEYTKPSTEISPLHVWLIDIWSVGQTPTRTWSKYFKGVIITLWCSHRKIAHAIQQKKKKVISVKSYFEKSERPTPDLNLRQNETEPSQNESHGWLPVTFQSNPQRSRVNFFSSRSRRHSVHFQLTMAAPFHQVWSEPYTSWSPASSVIGHPMVPGRAEMIGNDSLNIDRQSHQSGISCLARSSV